MNFPLTGRLVFCSLLFASYAFAQTPAAVFTDNVTYNVGDDVLLQVVLPKSETAPTALRFSATSRSIDLKAATSSPAGTAGRACSGCVMRLPSRTRRTG
jgi:Tfp pilus assembly protein PilZ